MSTPYTFEPSPTLHISTTLTQTEWEVGRWAVRGFSVKYIAKQMGVSPRTTETHLASVKRKLQVARRDELIEKYANIIV